MSTAISSAISGMRTAVLRLEASARNVANASSTAVPPDGVNAHPLYLLVRADQASLAGPAGANGVGAKVRNAAPAWMAAYQADASLADGSGVVASNVDWGHEALVQANARTSFMASAKTFDVTQDMVKRLFELADSD